MLPELHNGRISTDALFICHDLQTESDLVLVENMEAVNPGRDRAIRVTVACGILATVAVCLRFVARWRSKASFAADDWWIVASLIPLYCMLAVGSISSFVNLAFLFHADEFSDHEWGRRPAFGHVDREPNGNVSEGWPRSLHTYP